MSIPRLLAYSSIIRYCSAVKHTGIARSGIAGIYDNMLIFFMRVDVFALQAHAGRYLHHMAD